LERVACCKVQALLRTAIWLKAVQAGAQPERFEVCRRNLRLRAAALRDGPRAQMQEEKVRMRLWKQRDHLFTFLERADVPATNNLAERQLRPAVIARKISCGNKTLKGAQAWQTLASIAATCRQTGRSFIQLVAERVPRHMPRAPAAYRALNRYSPLGREENGSSATAFAPIPESTLTARSFVGN
jgi:hypothetical protein